MESPLVPVVYLTGMNTNTCSAARAHVQAFCYHWQMGSRKLRHFQKRLELHVLGTDSIPTPPNDNALTVKGPVHPPNKASHRSICQRPNANGFYKKRSSSHLKNARWKRFIRCQIRPTYFAPKDHTANPIVHSTDWFIETALKTLRLVPTGNQAIRPSSHQSPKQYKSNCNYS